jgi:phosphatidate cytidylyltransferase
MSPFWSRIVVALVLLPIVLYLVWLGGWWLTGLALAGGVAALHELYTISRSLRPIALGGFAGFAATVVGTHEGGTPWLVAGLAATLAISFALFGVSSARPPSFTAAIGMTLLGVVWVGGGLSALVLVRDLDHRVEGWEAQSAGRLAIFTVLLAVFADDTVAYAVGRLAGRHRMAPTISPGKSWEGFVAGTLAAIAVAFFALYQDRDVFLAIWQALVLGAAVALAAALGDLFESAVKRDLQVKDSGRLLAGHGGMLDRIDSLLFAGPAAYVTLLAFGVA